VSGKVVPKCWLWRGKVFSLFEEFLGYVLARDYVWAIFGFFYGLKEGFCGEIKCECLEFWIEKQIKEG